MVRDDHGALPRRLGRYIVVEHLASGGMGSVSLALQSTRFSGLDRPCVVKTVSDLHAESRAHVDRFLDEARTSLLLNHRNLCTTIDVDEADGVVLLAMEHIAGRNLRDLFDRVIDDRAALSIEEIVAIAIEVLDGLDFAHNLAHPGTGQPLGLVHRDISPHNVMVSFAGDVKVIDFGVARSRIQTAQTLRGTVVGKLRYMAPEQLAGHAVDRRADVAAVGILLVELLSGRRFYDELDNEHIVDCWYGDDAWRSPALDAVPERLLPVFEGALAVDPRARFGSAGALRDQLVAVVGAPRSGTLKRAMARLFPGEEDAWRRHLQELYRDAQAFLANDAGSGGPARRTDPAALAVAPTVVTRPSRADDAPPPLAVAPTVVTRPPAAAAGVPATTGVTVVHGAPATTPDPPTGRIACVVDGRALAEASARTGGRAARIPDPAEAPTQTVTSGATREQEPAREDPAWSAVTEQERSAWVTVSRLDDAIEEPTTVTSPRPAAAPTTRESTIRELTTSPPTDRPGSAATGDRAGARTGTRRDTRTGAGVVAGAIVGALMLVLLALAATQMVRNPRASLSPPPDSPLATTPAGRATPGAETGLSEPRTTEAATDVGVPDLAAVNASAERVHTVSPTTGTTAMAGTMAVEVLPDRAAAPTAPATAVASSAAEATRPTRKNVLPPTTTTTTTTKTTKTTTTTTPTTPTTTSTTRPRALGERIRWLQSRCDVRVLPCRDDLGRRSAGLAGLAPAEVARLSAEVDACLDACGAPR